MSQLHITSRILHETSRPLHTNFTQTSHELHTNFTPLHAAVTPLHTHLTGSPMTLEPPRRRSGAPHAAPEASSRRLQNLVARSSASHPTRVVAVVVAVRLSRRWRAGPHACFTLLHRYFTRTSRELHSNFTRTSRQLHAHFTNFTPLHAHLVGAEVVTYPRHLGGSRAAVSRSRVRRAERGSRASRSRPGLNSYHGTVRRADAIRRTTRAEADDLRATHARRGARRSCGTQRGLGNWRRVGRLRRKVAGKEAETSGPPAAGNCREGIGGERAACGGKLPGGIGGEWAACGGKLPGGIGGE